MYVCMYMNLSSVSLNCDISSVKAEMDPISHFQIFMKSNSLVNLSLDICFLSNSLSEHFIWWILETSRMYRCLDLKQISLIGLKEFNVKCLMSNTVQKDIRIEVLILLSSGKVDIDSLCNWKEWTH